MKIFLYSAISALLIACVITFSMGVNKLTKYEGPDDILYGEETVNSYVGGDAYNYIINSERATGMFVLAGFSFLSAVGLGVILQLEMMKQAAQVGRKQNVKQEEFDSTEIPIE